MPDTRPHLHVRVLELGDETVVELAGELDAATAPHVLQLGRRHIGLRPPLVLDLSDLTFLDAAGLRPIVRLSNAMPIRLRNPRPAVRALLSITGLDVHLDPDDGAVTARPTQTGGRPGGSPHLGGTARWPGPTARGVPQRPHSRTGTLHPSPASWRPREAGAARPGAAVRTPRPGRSPSRPGELGDHRGA